MERKERRYKGESERARRDCVMSGHFFSFVVLSIYGYEKYTRKGGELVRKEMRRGRKRGNASREPCELDMQGRVVAAQTPYQPHPRRREKAVEGAGALRFSSLEGCINVTTLEGRRR